MTSYFENITFTLSMTYKYYTKKYDQIFNSLGRYFQYTLNKTLEPIERNNASDISNMMLFIVEEEKDNPDLIRLLKQNRNIKIVRLGFDNDSDINLVDLPNLKNNLLTIINNPDLLSTALFSEDEIKDKLKNFLKGHGEESLFDGLNWTRYYFLNGPLLLINGKITEDEYRDNFCRNGMHYWDKFKKIYFRHKIFFPFIGLEQENEEIEENIKEFEHFLETGVKNSEMIINKLTEIRLYKNIDLLRKIDHILSNLANQFGLADVPIQPPYNR